MQLVTFYVFRHPAQKQTHVIRGAASDAVGAAILVEGAAPHHRTPPHMPSPSTLACTVL